MNYLIIIRGPLGIGKTTISKLLAQKLNAEYLSIDQVLEQNKLDIFDEKIGCIPEESFLNANQIIIQDILKNNQSVVIDGNFYYQNQINDLIKKSPFKTIVFTLTAPLEICIKRDSERQKSLGISATIAVYNLVSKFNFGEVIDISKLNEIESVDQIYLKLH